MKKDSLSPRFSVIVEVSGGRSIKNLISDGKYDWRNWNITQKNFPKNRQKTTRVKIEFFHFNKNISLFKAESKMKKEGFRPAVLRELLALGIHQPKLQMRFPIVALGSTTTITDVVKESYVVELTMANYGRGITLVNNKFKLGPRYRFATVKTKT